MHEVSIAQGLMKIVEDEAKRHNAKRITRIHVRVGALSNLVPDALHFAFETISKDTIAEGAELYIEEIPAMGRCEKCNIEFDVDATLFLCPQCNGIAAELVSGRELEVAELEAE